MAKRREIHHYEDVRDRNIEKAAKFMVRAQDAQRMLDMFKELDAHRQSTEKILREVVSIEESIGMLKELEKTLVTNI